MFCREGSQLCQPRLGAIGVDRPREWSVANPGSQAAGLAPGRRQLGQPPSGDGVGQTGLQPVSCNERHRGRRDAERLLEDQRAAGSHDATRQRRLSIYVTIEAVLPLGGQRLAIVNDTNFGSTGRNPELPDPSDFIVVRVPALRGE